MGGDDQWLIRQIMSGGHTGVDRAALDGAIRHGVPHGGWCPRGRLAADGPLPFCYQLLETDSTGYRQRTKLNVRDSDATLVFNMGALDGGTLQTIRFAQSFGKPYLDIRIEEVATEALARRVRAWVLEGKFNTLNVAGPREEKRPGIYVRVTALLDSCFQVDRC